MNTTQQADRNPNWNNQNAAFLGFFFDSFLTFNVCNYAGSLLGERLHCFGGSSQPLLLLLLASARAALVPLLALCNLAPLNRSHLPVLLPSDAAFVVLMVALSVSDGYITTVTLMFGPKAMEKK